MARVLIIEDERELAEILGEYLSLEGFEASIALDGQEGLDMFDKISPQLVVLDIMLPKLNGVEVCKKIRERSDVVIVMLSAKNGEMDKVICLSAGADDYITKPFSPLELVARVKAHIRRYSKDTVRPLQDGTVRVGRIELNKHSYEARIDGNAVELTTKEFEMLLYLCTNLNQVLSKEQIYNSVWGESEYGDIGTVAVYIKRLRAKLTEHKADYIKTVWGAGYKMTAEQDTV